MVKVFIGAILLFGLFMAFILVLSSGLDNQTHATMAQAHLEYTRAANEAMVIRAQSQAALNSAQASQANAIAFSMTMMTLVPWGVLFAVSLLGMGILGLVLTLGYFRHTEQMRPQIVYLPNPELPRREVWNSLSASRDIIQIEPTSVLHKVAR